MNRYIILSSILIVLSITIIVVNINHDYEKSPDKLVNKEVLLENISEEANASNDYSFLFIVNDNACPACIHNMREYIEIIENRYQIIIGHIIKDRYNNMTRLKKLYNTDGYINYEIITNENEANKLILLDYNLKPVSMSYISNNVVTSIEMKKEIVDNHLKSDRLDNEQDEIITDIE